MARKLVTENCLGESAAAIWRQIQAENGKILIPATIAPEPAPVGENAPLTTSLVTPALTIEGGLQSSDIRIVPSTRVPTTAERGDTGEMQFPLF